MRETVAAASVMAGAVIATFGALPHTARVLRLRGACLGVSLTVVVKVFVPCVAWAMYSAAAGMVLSIVSSLLWLTS